MSGNPPVLRTFRRFQTMSIPSAYLAVCPNFPYFVNIMLANRVSTADLVPSERVHEGSSGWHIVSRYSPVSATKRVK